MWPRPYVLQHGPPAAARMPQPPVLLLLLLLLSRPHIQQAAEAAVAGPATEALQQTATARPTSMALAAATRLILGQATSEQVPASKCQLSIQGSKPPHAQLLMGSASRPQATVRATLTCTGSPVTAAAHGSIAASLKKTAAGMQWDPDGCENLGCLVTICGSNSVVFEGARVQGVWARSLSAAVCVSGSSRVLFKGGVFTDIHTSQGALLVVGASQVLLEGTRVINNTANVAVGPMTMGGGMLVQEQAQVSLMDCLFAGNQAIGNVAAFGAAIAAQDESRVRLLGGVFQGNAALAPAKAVGAALGGAIYAEGSASLEARGTTFLDNFSDGDVVAVGGAMCVLHNATLKLMSCTFTNNTAKSPNIGVGGGLGALNHTTVHITDCNFVGNSAFGGSYLGAGGALLADNHAAILVRGTKLLGNGVSGSTVGAGGAINANANVTLSLRDSVVSGNVVSAPGAVLGGGVSCLNTSRCLFQDSVLTHNSVTSSSMPAAGGGLGVLDQATVHVVRCNISHNLVRGGLAVAGGGIMTQGNDTKLTVDNCTFEYNTVAANEFTGSYAGGGAVGAQGPVVVNLTNLHRSYRPGTSQGFVVLRSCSFLQNTVGGVTASTGGAVFAGDGAVRIMVDSCHFVGNAVGGIPGFVTPPLICCGGAVAVQERSVLNVTASGFESNSVEGVHACGGAACAQNGGTLRLVASRFVRNVAGGVSNATGPGGVLRGGMTCGGGACATNNGTIEVHRCEFDSNLASGVSGGGGLCVASTSRLAVSHSAFRHNEAKSSGGAVGIGGGCTAVLSNTSFVNNTATNPETGSGGAVGLALEPFEAEQPASCVFDNCTFVENSAIGRRGSGGGVSAASADLVISSSSFSANTAQQGGALAGSGPSWDIRNSSFTNHSVAGPGGAIFATGSLEAAISGCEISMNRGSEGGGVYAASSPGHKFNLATTDTRISSNQAQTGGGMFLKAGLTEIGPGATISRNYASQQAGGIAWVGTPSQSCGSGAACKSILGLSCGALISDNRAAVAGGGLFLGEPYDTDLEVVGKSVAQVVRNNSAAFGSVDIFQLSSVCKAGQVSKGGWCDECVAGTFSFDPHAHGCERCPDHAVCLAGAVVLPESGFWHSTNNSTQIHPCPNPLACAHSPEAVNIRQPVDRQCSEGFMGRVCGSCEEGYGFTMPFKCGRCMSQSKTVGLYTAALLCLWCFLSYSAHTTFKDNMQQRTTPRVSDTIKTLVLYLNYLVIFSSIRVDWPKSLSILYTAASWLMSSASGQVLSLDCLLPHGGSIPLAIKRQLVYLFVPLAMTLLVLLFLVGAWACPCVLRCRRTRRRPAFARVAAMLPTAVLVSLYLFFPGFVRVAWGMFACLKLDDAHSSLPFPQYAVATAASGYWVQDMTQACYEGWHLSWSMGLGLLCILLFCVGVPVALFAWLAANRHRLRTPEFQKHFGFLFADFRLDRWWWEAFVAARTVLLVCIAVFASVIGPYYGVVMFVVVIHLSLALQLALCPFAFAQMHRVQLAALGCLDITGCVTLTFFMVDWHSPSRAFSAYKEVAGALLLTMHVCFLCWCLWVMLAAAPLRCVRTLATVLWTRTPHMHCARLHLSCGSCYRPKHAEDLTLPAVGAAVPAVRPAQLQNGKLGKSGGLPASGCNGCSSSLAAASPTCSSSSMNHSSVFVSLPQPKDTEATLDIG